LKTFFLTSQRDKASSNFGQHGTSNSWRKHLINASFQLVSHLRFLFWPFTSTFEPRTAMLEVPVFKMSKYPTKVMCLEVARECYGAG
jgi:hypothetical protein